MNTGATVTEVLKIYPHYSFWRVDVVADYMGHPVNKTLEFKTETEARDMGEGYEID